MDGRAGTAGQAPGIVHYWVEYVGRNCGDAGGGCGGEHFCLGEKQVPLRRRASSAAPALRRQARDDRFFFGATLRHG